MKAFTDTTQTKEQALAMMREHQRLDHIVQGTYTQGEGVDFKGCLVGCATAGKHMAFEPEFGIPWRVAWLADDIFEGLKPEDAKQFAVQFFEAVPEGADLGRVYDGWCAWMLADPVDGLVKISEEPSVAAMGALFARAAQGDEPTPAQWEEAARAARAARAAWAAWAAWDAWDARDARAAWAVRAAWAAWDEKISKTAEKQRDKLLELVRASAPALES